jgi:hypothetical protein
MNDFLKNLRSHRKKDRTPLRNPSGNTYYPPGERYPAADRRTLQDRRTAHPSDNDMAMLARQLVDILPDLMDTITCLSQHAKQWTRDNQDLTRARIERENAMAELFISFGQLVRQEKVPIPDKTPRATSSYTVGSGYTKEDILSMIRAMRKQGQTFSRIAQSLKEKKIPTFSGRGQWHAQTIHRLFK